MKALSDAQIELINKIGYTFVADTSLTLDETETLETLKLRFVRIRMRSGVSGTTYYELSKRGFALYEEMKAAAADDIEPEAPTEATLGDELYEESAASVEETPALTADELYAARFNEMNVPLTQEEIDRLHADEPTGPARNADERAAMDMFNEGYDYLEMKPMDTPFVPVIGEHAMFAGLRVKVTARYADGFYRIVYFDEKRNAHSVSRAKGSDLKALYEDVAATIDPRDAEIEQLKAENAALKAAQGLFPVRVYNAYLDTQDTRLSQVPYAQACMRLKDVMSTEIVNRPTGYPIVQGDC